MLDCCREATLQAQGLPDAHAAYREACLAPEPKHAQRWSHPAVFHAGRDAGWFFLASTTEAKAFPVFEKHYRAVCDRIVAGEVLQLPAPDQAETSAAALAAPDADEQRARLAKLRAETGM